jgi:hypothetical protein
MLTKILSYLKANPAVAAALVSVALTLGARFGLNLDANQLAVFAAIITAASHGTVHVATRPAGEHEAAPREEHS